MWRTVWLVAVGPPLASLAPPAREVVQFLVPLFGRSTHGVTSPETKFGESDRNESGKC